MGKHKKDEEEKIKKERKIVVVAVRDRSSLGANKEQGRQCTYKVLPRISENLNIPRKPLALRTCAARCLLLYI
jgi:hypothetical protein